MASNIKERLHSITCSPPRPEPDSDDGRWLRGVENLQHEKDFIGISSSHLEKPEVVRCVLHPPPICIVNREVAPYLLNLCKLGFCRTTSRLGIDRVCRDRSPGDQPVTNPPWTGKCHSCVVLFQFHKFVCATFAQLLVGV
jgi:hypothetical protein